MRDDVDLDRLIPHRPPMRLVESVNAIDDERVESVCTVRASWPSARDGEVPSLMLVELVAQSAAVLQGWKERHDGEAGRGGFLVGIPTARFAAATVPVGTQLVCLVRPTHGIESYRVFDGEVRDLDGKVWFAGAIQAFRPDQFAQPGGAE